MEQRALLAHRARVEEWREEAVAGSERMQRLRELATSARDRLGSMDAIERRGVLDDLDVRVTVIGWSLCELCSGKGKVKGGNGGLPCPSCRAARRVPHLRLQGVVLDGDMSQPSGGVSRHPAAGMADYAGLPFSVDLVAA